MNWSRAIVLALIAAALSINSVLAQDSPAASSGATQSAAAGYEPGPAELSAFGLLTIARTALQELQSQQREVDRQASYYSAITGLTGLYQLHGCEWALPRLVELQLAPDCPEMHLGYSEDGRFSVRVELLELQRAEFADYAVMLVTLESNTSLNLKLSDFQPMQLEMITGTQVIAEPVVQEHPLWDMLDRLAPTFQPRPVLPSGSTFTFKQLYSIPAIEASKIRQVGLGWLDYSIEVPFYENLTDHGRSEASKSTGD